MTDLRDAARQALEALEALKQRGVYGDFHGVTDALRAALTEEALQRLTDVHQEIEAALEQPEQAEPSVACSNTFACRCPKHFTHPPREQEPLCK